MPKLLSSLLRVEAGATSIEYGLIAAFISVIIIASVTLLGPEFQSVFQRIANAL
jgi:pilus assembly protein Flp/PilA